MSMFDDAGRGLWDEDYPKEPVQFARETDPVTSHEAAALKRGFPWRYLLAACQLVVFDDDLLAETIGDDRNIAARRRLDLERADCVERQKDRKGEQVYAVGRSGTRVLTFRVTARGEEQMMKELKRRGIR